MSAKEYIKKKLSEFLLEFKTAKVSYEYDALAATHSIQVLPQEVYDSSKFSEWLNEFYKDAIAQYPDDFIAFISQNDYPGLTAPEYELCGTEYPASPEHTSVTGKAIKYYRHRKEMPNVWKVCDAGMVSK
jgi:hypothetical protein